MPARFPNGFTLLEVMVAIFVLAVGLLALAAVQLKTYAAMRETEYQSIAAQHVESLAEAMRANPKRSSGPNWSWQHYVEAQPGAAALSPTTVCSSTQTSATSSTATRCNQDAQANYELYLFKSRLAAAFPHADSVAATVCPSNDLSQLPQISNLHCDATGPLAIKVAWRVTSPQQHSLDANAPQSMGYQVRFSP